MRLLRDDRPFVGVVAFALFAAGLVYWFGPLGALSGIALVVLWYVGSPLFAFAGAQVVFGVLVQPLDVNTLVALEAGILLAVGMSVSRPGRRLRTAITAGIALLALGSLTLSLYQWFDGIRPATILAAASVIVFSYVLVRYEFVIRALAEER
ncbi:hypothetical protein [Haladaptatus sp. DYSN1]|uniref:hypothetical protein n=1 Tax=unclassified Haladaptatus TaxID=2622732 RepID=UPI002406987F|nr:hypothetical protein [Haladaptatus sp. DYSN1]